MDQEQERDLRLARLEAALAEMQHRLDALEGRRGTQIVTREALASPVALLELAPVEPPPAEAAPRDLTGLATLLGRAFMVFGGAYLLRALTESGRVPATAGVIIGLAYCAGWMIAAHRSAATRPTSAQFHGVTALLVALPLVWEATARFGLMSPGAAALTLAGISGAAFAVAWRGRLDVVAAVAGFGTVAAAFATASSTNHFAAFSLLLIGLSVVTYWMSEQPRHAWLRWPNAAAAGLSVIGVTIRALGHPPLEAPGLTLIAQAAFVATMQGSLAVRLLMLGRNARFFDVMQAASGLVIGIGGAVMVSGASPGGLGLIGAVAGILALGAYLGAFLRLSDRPHLSASYHLLAAFGLVTAIAALALLFSGPILALVAITLGIITIGLGPHRLAGYAALHGSAYVLTALAASGLLTASLSAWMRNPTPWPSVSTIGWLTLGTAGICATLRPPQHGDIGDLLARVGRRLLAALFVFAASGAVLMVTGPLIAGTPPDAGVLATLRTTLLSLTVIGLGLAARLPQTRVFARLVYPLLIVGGLRFVADDFRHSGPATLFIALAVYGLAWVLGPRLAARDSGTPAG